jgi:SAM-dependent methyltransferase
MDDSPAPLLGRYLAGLEGSGLDSQRFLTYLQRLFAGVPLAGRRVLDVGGGSGAISFYAGVRGANVVCLEPGAEGSNPQMEAAYRRLEESVGGAVHVALDRRTLQQLDAQPGTFDVIVLHNSVNHLDEQACVRLPADPGARRTFVELFSSLRETAQPGGDLILSDCARWNLFGALRARNPFVPEIEWELHQQPRVWAQLLGESGFLQARIRWNPMTRAGRAGELVLANWLGAFMTQSHFTLNARVGAN